MSKLPTGYLEMERDGYATLDVATLRAIYAELREIVRYTMGYDNADTAILAQSPVTPVDWVVAVKQATCGCPRCKGTGVYCWGACVNGQMQHSAPCARCGGNGQMSFDDMRRGRAYDNYAIRRACGF